MTNSACKYGTKKMKTLFATLALLVSIALMLGSCGSGGQTESKGGTAVTKSTAAKADGTSEKQEQTGIDPSVSAALTISNVGNADDEKNYSYAIDRFKKRFPNVTVKDTYNSVSAWGEYANKVIALIAAGNVPDVVYIASEGSNMLIKRGLLEPIDRFVDNPKSADLKNDIEPALLDLFKVDGKRYMFPISWNNMVIYYNTKMFKDAGIEPPKENWTWDDFLNIAKKLTKGEGKDKIWGYGSGNYIFFLTPWFVTNDSYMLKNDLSDSNLDDPNAIEAIQFVHDLIQVHKVTPVPEQNVDNVSLFINGRLAMFSGGHWPVASLKAANFTDYDVQVWPQKKKQGTVAGVGAFGISKASKNKELAWELIKELVSKETSAATVSGAVQIPARRSDAMSDIFLKSPANSKIFYESAKYAKSVPNPPNYSEVEQIWTRYISDIMTGKVYVTDGMASLHKEVQAAMDKMKADFKDFKQ